MIEALFVIAIILILVSVHVLVVELKKPVLYYVRISAGIALLILVWGFGHDARMIPKVIHTGLALTSLLGAFISLETLPIRKESDE